MNGKLLEFAKLYGYEENNMHNLTNQPLTDAPILNKGQALLEALAAEGREWWVLNEINNVKPEDALDWDALHELRQRIIKQIRTWEAETGKYFPHARLCVIRCIVTEKLLKRLGVAGVCEGEPVFR